MTTGTLEKTDTNVQTRADLENLSMFPRKLNRARGLAFKKGLPLQSFDKSLKRLPETTLRNSSAAKICELALSIHYT